MSCYEPMSSSPRHRWLDLLRFSPDPAEPYLRIQSVSIFVRDQDKSLKFYLDQLGFRLIHDAEVKPGDG
jgi:hypothetical protein